MSGEVERSILGDEEPDAVWRRLCPEAVECFAFEVSVGALFGLVVRGGERVALKVHRTATAEHLAALQQVQEHLWRYGFPCPRPLGVRGRATLEEWRDEGMQRDAREPPVRRAMAALLMRLINLTRDLRPAVDLAPFFPRPGGALWPAPHAVTIDFEAAAAGAAWIDEIAAAARTARDVGGSRLVIAHHDWTAKHVRFAELEPVVVHDWDSVSEDYEPVHVGDAAEHFTWDGTFPTADESLLFIADYERARSSPFTRQEQAVAAAAAVYARAYTSATPPSTSPGTTRSRRPTSRCSSSPTTSERARARSPGRSRRSPPRQPCTPARTRRAACTRSAATPPRSSFPNTRRRCCSRLRAVPDLSGKVAIVTGAGRGIGRAHAVALAGAGAKVVVNDLGGSLAGEGADLSPAEQVVAEIQGAGGEAVADGENVADFAGAERLVQHALDAFGRLDIVVNNAGILRDRMLVNMEEGEWDTVIAVHLKGHFAVTHHAAAHWRERAKAGEQLHARVINTSSPSGVFGNVGQTNYGAAKAGIAGFTLIAAQELGRYGVTVNCLAPNARTRMTEETFEMGERPEGFDPLDPTNIAPVVVALCADDAQDITGQVFHIWGGAVNALQGWTAGELFQRDDGWDADALLAEMLERFPDGAAPEGMVAGMQKAGGRSLRA